MSLEARVKSKAMYPTYQSCAGRSFTKEEWSKVPEEFEPEAKSADFLDTRSVVNGGTGGASKQAQELAQEQGIDLGDVKGTGAGGNITVKDVKEVIEKKG